ncbi:MAG: hypothetical protein IT234_05810 [Bacteroidia bacterium]|nr:hypothetical protein [Bacteroidia bacterium]
MKTLILTICSLLLFSVGFAQKGHGHKGNHQSKSVKHGIHHHSSNGIMYYQPVKVKRKGPPSWAPANGYRHRYIFFPEHKCYYDNFNGIYIYRKGSIWVTSYQTPSFIFNISITRKVELNIDGVSKPQIYFKQHVALYN